MKQKIATDSEAKWNNTTSPSVNRFNIVDGVTAVVVGAAEDDTSLYDEEAAAEAAAAFARACAPDTQRLLAPAGEHAPRISRRHIDDHDQWVLWH